MKKHYKITSAVLTASLLITPITSIFIENQNVAKANHNLNQEKINKKIINDIDKYIYQENGILKINKNDIQSYIIDNWSIIKNGSAVTNPYEYVANIENSINVLNGKINSGWYKLNFDNSISEKYSSRGNRGGYETYNYWWGAQFYARTSWGAENLARDCEENAYGGGIAGIFIGGFAPPVGVALGLAAINYDRMAQKVRDCFSDHGSVKLTIYLQGAYFETEPIQ